MENIDLYETYIQDRKSIMKTTPALLVQEYSEDEKKRLQLVGAFYSSTHKGWFLTQEQMATFEVSNTDPSVLPTPAVKTEKGIGIFIDDLGSEWKVYGETFKKKDALKNPALDLKPRWNPSDKSWRISREKIDRQDLEQLLM
jgi:hypothetical protein